MAPSTPSKRAQLHMPASRRPTPRWMGWQSWESLAVKLANVPKEANTFVLWDAFSKEGTVISIDIFEDSHGRRDTKGRIRFKPPPASDFWKKGHVMVKMRSGRVVPIVVFLDLSMRDPYVPSPVRPGITYPAEIGLPFNSLDIGVPLSETNLCWMRKFEHSAGPKLMVDVKRRALFVFFRVLIHGNRSTASSKSEDEHDFRLKIPFLQMTGLYEQQGSTSNEVSFFTIMDSPAIYHRRLRDVKFTFTEENNWRETDTWYRQTSVVHNPYVQNDIATNLRRTRHIIDIGRWNAFKFTFTDDVHSKGQLDLLREILKDHNIPIENGSHFTEGTERPLPVWRWIDLSEAKPTGAFSHMLQDLDYVHLPFSVRYQLEVCLSHGYLSEFTMTRDFVVKLAGLGEPDAKRLLEHVATDRTTFYNPMEIFNLKFVKGVSESKIPAYCCFMRTARVTPSTVYYNTPTVDTSNRVLRRYIEVADRFLRVRFTDEKLQGRINSAMNDTNDEVFSRIKRTLSHGITIGDRHYEFLAFGNSQFREHGAYFFAPLPDLTASRIRAWMGQFNHIRNIAKHAARLGQCFSTTRAVAGCPVKIQKCHDIVRNGYTFSDGIGKISKFLAQMVMSELKIKTPTGDPPSAFQFRLGGSKGMLAVSPDPQPHEVHIRPSQYKFNTDHGGLEIIRWSQFSIATLNRQLILVLSALGVPDRVFHSKLNAMLRSFNEAMSNDVQATYLLQRYVDPNQVTLTLAQMVFDGFRRTKEPFVTSMLALWNAWHLKYLKEKAKIVLDQGANLLGCLDETGTLKGYFDSSLPGENGSYEKREAALPEIFVQICRLEKGDAPEVIEGICILARNPSLHPGDIRVVRAVNKPELHHLRDVVVLPQTGDRDVASMCSGGDLDGDDYLVIWDQEMIPRLWFTPPMDYTSLKAPDIDHDVTVNEITSFFVMYMKNDYLPMIAHAHLAWADRLDDGVWEDKCMQLAQLHSIAVDYNKTGGSANMTRSLRPRQWPHFMEKKYKRKEEVYHSKSILGQLYDEVELIDFVPNLEMPFDTRVLDCELKAASGEFLSYAKTLKQDYDSAMRRVMAQYEIKTEFEVWTSFVLSHSPLCKEYKLHEDLGKVANTLRGGFRKQCYDKVGGRTFELLAPLVVAMYRVTHEETRKALDTRRLELELEDDASSQNQAATPGKLPLISFPWMFSEVLGQIATGHFDVGQPQTEGRPDAFGKNNPTIFTHAQVVDLLSDFEVEEIGIEPIKPPTCQSTGFIEPLSDSEAKRPTDQDSGIDVDEAKPILPAENIQEFDEIAPSVDISIDKDENNDLMEGGMVLKTGDEDMELVDMVEKAEGVKPSALDKLLRLIHG